MTDEEFLAQVVAEELWKAEGHGADAQPKKIGERWFALRYNGHAPDAVRPWFDVSGYLMGTTSTEIESPEHMQNRELGEKAHEAWTRWNASIARHSETNEVLDDYIRAWIGSPREEE